MRPAPSAGRRPRADRTVTGRVLARLRRTLVAALVLVVGFSGVDAAFALWQDRAAASGGTVTTGSASLEAQWHPGHEESAWQDLLPGESAARELTLENSGAVPLEVTMTLADGPQGLVILAGSAPLVIEPGQHLTLSVELTATEDLHPDDEIDVEVLLEGRQIR